VTSPNPHVENAKTVMGEAYEGGTQGQAWQKLMLMLMQAQVEATLAVAVELRAIIATRGEAIGE
jgi:hypothetical protein